MVRQDFAFIKNDDGTFTYSILALRFEHPRGSDGRPGDRLDECLTFATSVAGDTRRVTKDRWADSVRLVSVDGGLATRRDDGREDGGRHRRGNSDPGIADEEWAPPDLISFLPADEGLDDVSKLSSVGSRRR